MASYRIQAPCKINLHLEVGPPGGDGFHPICSLFHTVPLYDEIKVTVSSLRPKPDAESAQSPFRLSLQISPPFFCPTEDNLTFRAAKAFLEAARLPVNLHLELKKQIPAGAGLGGGSSDAGTLLAFLNRLFHRPLTESRLLQLASGLGSDVPFFVTARAAEVGGRGERVTPLPPLHPFHLLLLFPPVSIDTRSAYRWLDEAAAYSSSLSDAPVTDYRTKPPREWSFANSFQPVICSRYPVVAEALQCLQNSGADFVSMSGSGPTVFALYSTKTALNRAYSMVKSDFPNIWRKKSLLN